MSFSSTPKTAFFYFSRRFSNWGGEFLSKSLGAISSPRTDGFVTEGVCGGELGRRRATVADLCFNYSNGHSFTEGARRPAEYWSHPGTLHLKSQGVHSELPEADGLPHAEVEHCAEQVSAGMEFPEWAQGNSEPRNGRGGPWARASRPQRRVTKALPQGKRRRQYVKAERERRKGRHN